MGHLCRMKSNPWLALLVIAALAGGAYWFNREQEVRECRRAAVSASQPAYDGGNETIRAGLALARQIDAEKVADCYRRGLLATPNG